MADGGRLFCYSIRWLARRQLSIPRMPPRPGRQGPQAIPLSRTLARVLEALSGADVEQSYLPSFEKLLELSLIAFIAILGPFHPMISSFLSSSSSVAMKNFSSSC